MNELDKLWDEFGSDPMRSIKDHIWRTTHLAKIKVEGYKLLEELEMVHKVNKSLSDEKEKNRRVCLEMVTEREQKLEAIRKLIQEPTDFYTLQGLIGEVLGE